MRSSRLMRTLRLSLVGTVILALLGGPVGVATAQDEPAATAGTPIPGDGVTVEILTQVTIAASDLLESVDSVALVHLLLPGESSSTWMHEDTALQILCPLDGELWMPVTGRTEVIRASGDVAALDTGVALSAEPGDTVVGYDLSLPKVYANPAATPVEWLDATFAQGGGGEGDILLLETGPTLEFPNGYWLMPDELGEAGLPDPPLLVTMRRVTLEPGGRIEVDNRYPAIRLVEGAPIDWTFMKDGVPTGNPIRMTGVIFYVRTEPGSVIELSNPGSGTAMFYELTIEPASSE